MADHARFFLPRDVELQLLDEADVLRAQAASYEDQATPQLADRLSQLSRTYPGARPGVLMAAAQGGLGDDEVRELVSADYEAQSQDQGWLSSIKDVASDLANTAGRFLGGAVTAGYEQALKPLARGVTTVAEGLFDEIIQRPMVAAEKAEGNLFTNPGAFGQAYRETGASVLGQSVSAIARGERPDLGEGFFAGGGIRENVHNTDLETQIGGKSSNFGRVLTKSTISNLPVVGEYVKPGTQAFNVVSGITQIGGELALDPFSKIVKGANAVKSARKSLSAATADDLLKTTGAVENGANSGLLVERAEQFLGRKDIIRKLTDTTDFDTIWKGAKGRLTPEQALEIAESGDDANTARVVLNQIAHGDVKDKGFYSGFGKIRQSKDQVRLAKQMPGSHLDLSDSSTAVRQLDDLMGTVKLDAAAKSRNNANMARALRDGGSLDDIEEVMRGVHHDMAIKFRDDYGIDPDAVKELVEYKKHFTTSNRVYAHDALGDPFYFPGSKLGDDVGGVERAKATAQLLAEYSENLYALPDARELRKAAQKWSVLRKIYTSKKWDSATAKADKVMKVWKPLAYVRLAYIPRVPLGEEQVRIWADADQMVASPMGLARAIAQDPKKAKDLLGNQLDDIDSFKHAMASEATEQLMDRQTRKLGGKGWTTVDRSHNNFAQGWKTELNQVASDPVARGVLTEADPYEWFISGGGRKFREQLAKGSNHAKKAYIDDDVARTIKKAPGSDETFASADEAARAYIDSVRRRIDEITGGPNGDVPNPHLVDAIRNNAVDDLNLADLVDSAPSRVKVPVDEAVWREQDKRMFNRVFEAIVIHPTNRVARSRAYRGYQGKAYVDLLDAATPAVRRQMLKAAKETQDGAVVKAMTKRLKKLEKDPKTAKGGTLDDIADVNDMAHHRAADQTKKLLYDMTRRGHFADATRHIFPFAEAWVEMMTTWGRLLPKRPDILRKAQVVMEGGESMGFFEDNDFGDKVFNYPGGSALYDWATEGGGQIQMQGRLGGMNMLATGVGPGFGPLVQWPVSAFASGSPDLEWFVDAVAPFGSDLHSPSDLADLGKLGSEFAPAYAKKVLGGLSNGKFGSEENYHRTIGDVAVVLAQSGKYEPGDPKLMEDAETRGKFVHVIRGFAQSILPTGPDLSFEFEDKTGQWLTMRNLAESWNEIREEVGDDIEATRIFDQRYGLEPWYVSSSKSQTIRYRPSDEAGDEWVKRNQDIVKQFPNVAGYFAPEGGDYSYSAWRRGFATGDKAAYTPEQRIALADKQKAWMIYNRQQELTEGMDSSARSAYLSEVKMDLEEDFPGWQDPVPETKHTATRDQKIAELRRAVEHPQLAETEVGQALSTFLQRYDQSVQIMRQRDPSAKQFGAKRDADLIEYLSQVGNDLAQDMPSFKGMWTYIFEPEFS